MMTSPDNFMINENYQQFHSNNVSDINMNEKKNCPSFSTYVMK